MPGAPSAITRMPAPVKWPAFFMGAVLCVLAGLQVHFLVAEMDAMVGRRWLQAFRDDPARYQPAGHAQAEQAARRALQRLPANPDYVGLVADLLAEQCRRLDVVGQWTEWQACQQGALAQWRRLAEMNPASPFAWANLMQTKFQLRQFDTEFYRAWDEAIRLGAHELEVNRVVAYVGLREWARWTPRQVMQVRRATEALQAAWPRVARQTAQDAGMLMMYCFWTAGDARQPRVCTRKPAARKRQAREVTSAPVLPSEDSTLPALPAERPVLPGPGQ